MGLSYNTSNTGSQFTFSATPSGLASYQWDFGDGTTGSGQTTAHTYQSSGNFKVELTTQDTCSGSLTYSDTVSTCLPSLRVPILYCFHQRKWIISFISSKRIWVNVLLWVWETEHRRPPYLQALRIHFLQLVLIMWFGFMPLMIVGAPSR